MTLRQNQREQKEDFPAFIGKNNSFRIHSKNIDEHSDSMIEDGIARAAWESLATLRLPACCQDSVEGSQLKIVVK